jgi:hypothetical protein
MSSNERRSSRSLLKSLLPRERGEVYSSAGVLIGWRCDLSACCLLDIQFQHIFTSRIKWRQHHSAKGPHKGTGLVEYRGGAISGNKRAAAKRLSYKLKEKIAELEHSDLIDQPCLIDQSSMINYFIL